MTEIELKAIHAQACVAVAVANRALTPSDDAFWPIYLQAALSARDTSVNEIHGDGK